MAYCPAYLPATVDGKPSAARCMTTLEDENARCPRENEHLDFDTVEALGFDGTLRDA
jgi:hypothetical protein